jgi:hypothetical protein
MKGVEHRLWSCENARKLLAVEIVAATFRQGRTPGATPRSIESRSASISNFGREVSASCEIGTRQ